MAKYLIGSDQLDVKRLIEELDYCDYLNAKTFRNSSLNSGTWGDVTYGAKSSGYNIIVGLCDLYWWPVYLSKNNSGDVILTLMLIPENPGLNDLCGVDFGGGVQGVGANGGATYYEPCTFRADDYSGTTFLGGTNVDFNLEQLEGYSEVFGERMDCLIDEGVVEKPQSMPWQENQSAKEILGWPYNLSNESWSTTLSDDGFYSSQNNYAHISGSNSWASSYLWLPSLSEIGYWDGDCDGLWGVEMAQRMARGYDICIMTRSANYKQSYGYYGVDDNDDVKLGVLRTVEIRPCIHLNLSEICVGWY